MTVVASGARVTLKNILYLTDFSEPSEAALPFAMAIAREYQAKVYLLHVLSIVPIAQATPAEVMIEAREERAESEMQRLESQLAGLPHETSVERGPEVWPLVEGAIKEYGIDLIVLGTHGRTGYQKLLLGSTAEEIFRRSYVPVLTIGPWSRLPKAAKFQHLLFATDFTQESLAAVPYAVSMAQENESRLILLHVLTEPTNAPAGQGAEESVANAISQLRGLIPTDAELWCRPEPVVRYGNPAEQILEAAIEHEADLIILGMRNVAVHLRAATRLERTTAHKVVAHATCPVLTVCAGLK